MRPPCELVVRYVLPTFRSLVAKELIEKYDLSQVARGIAKGKLSALDAMTVFCRLCEELRTKNAVCELHKDMVPLPENCNICLKK